MMLDTREMISVTEANQNFSRATRIADQRGKAVILKGNPSMFCWTSKQTPDCFCQTMN